MALSKFGLWGKQRHHKIRHSTVPSRIKIAKYINNFPVQIALPRGTKTAVHAACRKYLGKSYLHMVNYKICVHDEGTWVYHNGILYLKNPADQTIVTLGMLTKR